MAWLQLLLAVVVGAAALGLPGVAIGLGLRLRGLWLASVAPGLGLTAIIVGAVIASFLRLRWSMWVVLVTAAIIALGVWVCLRATPTLRPRPPSRGAPPWVAPIAASVGGILLLGRAVVAIGTPEWFAQAGDNVFHLNAVRWILEHGDAAPWGFREFSGNPYPDGWHAVVALVCQISGVSIPVASNATLIVIACGVWPLGIVLLTRVLFGDSPAVLISAGVVSSGFSPYPLLLIPYMGTYPLLLSIALVAPALAAVVEGLRLGRDRIGAGAALSVAALMMPGLVCAHPSAFVMLCVMTVPPVATAAWTFGRLDSARRRLYWLIATFYVVCVLAVVIVVRPGGSQPDSLRSTAAEAWGEVVFGGYAAQPIPLALTLLTVVGIATVFRARTATGVAAVGVWLAVGGVYVAAKGGDEFVRLVFSGPWFADATRVAAFTPIAAAPLAAYGASVMWRFVTRVLRDRALVRRLRLRPVGIGIVAVGIFATLLVSSTAARSGTAWTRSMFQPTDNVLTSPIPVNGDDREIFRWVADHVPDQDVLAGDPWNGTGFAYALTSNPVLVWQMLQPIEGPVKTFLDEFSSSSLDGAGCQAARELKVRWVLDLHPGKRLPSRPVYEGVQDLATSPNVELAHRVGESSIYRVTGCAIK
ncbi:hypothetical protein J2X85_002808 [Microbacterium trichothecenolyticum]|uniref:DUF6541 family protein n=1 Tax=Microbacterium trichothecenolyticum TaxID=69370 RepID=UPI00285692B4|nr:DUF6541 family protein [Microbacterium trichothecenolyticum]MDR7185772.1 hypothetical protein [Microbacterium trichothecenolyticum]